MKAIILSLDPAEAIKTIIDIAKENNSPKTAIGGINFAVEAGIITREEGNAAIQKTIQPKLEMVKMAIPELGGMTYELTNFEANKYYDSGVLPKRFQQTTAPAEATTQTTAPGGAPAPVTSRQAPLSLEEMEAKKTALIEQSKADIAASTDLLAQKSFAKQQKDSAKLVLGYAKTSPKSFGVLADPNWRNATASLLESGVSTPWGSVGLAVEEPIAKLKLTGPEATVRQMAAAPISLIEVGYRKLYLRGEGQVTQSEGSIVKAIGPQMSDNPRSIQLKAGMIIIGAEKQEKVIDAFEKYKEQNPESGPRSFYQTPEYKRIVDTYETKYRAFAEKNGIPIGESSIKKSSGSLADRIRQERANAKNKEGR